jgi:cobalt-zinc-cadmium efflux system membrane fusion protein
VLDNHDMLLKPEMFARITVLNEGGTQALCVPTNALISVNGKNYVVVYKSRDDVKNVEISVIKTVGEKTYISEGLDEGEMIITKYQLLIFNQLLSNR